MIGIRRHLVVVVGLLVSAVALYLVLGSLDVGEAARIIAGADPLPLLGIVTVVALQLVARTLRWSLLLPRLPSGDRVSALRLLPALLIGYLGNAVLPARLGEPMRALIVSRRERIGVPEAMGSVLVERAIDVATLAIVAFIASTVVDAPTWSRQALGVAAALGFAGIVVLATIGLAPVLRVADRFGLARQARLREIAARFAASVGGKSHRPAILAAASVSTGAWLLDGLSFWLAAQAVGIELAYGGALLVAGITVLGTALPSAPGYVGTFELAAAGMAGALGVPAAPALAMAVVAHAMTLLPLALGGAVSLALIGTSLGSVAHDAAIQRSS